MQNIKLRQTTETNGGSCMSKRYAKRVPCALKHDAKGVPWASKSNVKGFWSGINIWRVGSENLLMEAISMLDYTYCKVWFSDSWIWIFISGLMVFIFMLLCVLAVT